MVYLINMLLILFWNYALPKSINNRKKILCLIYCLQWVLLSGLRNYSVGADTLAYKNSFDDVFNTSWGELFRNFTEYFKGVEDIKDPGYALIEKFCQIFIGNDYTLFLLIIAIVFTVPMAIWVYKYSDNVCLSFMIYSALFYSFFAITGHRQTIASALVIFGGYECIKKNKWLPLIILQAIAFFIHKSSICFIALYVVRFIKINKVYWAFSIIFIILAFIFRAYLMKVLGHVMGYESYTDQFEGAGAYKFTFFLLLIFIGAFLLYSKTDKCVDTDYAVKAITLATIFTPLTFIDPSAMRVVQYFSVFIMILVPKLIQTFDYKTRGFAEAMSYIVLIGAIVINLPQYSFVF